jgi:orotate phosphoribosyltransferase
MIYIRKKRKDHASKKQIEGALEPGENVLLYEDLITDGSSKLGFCDAVREAGADMKHCIVILDREQGGEEKLGEHGISLYSMTKLTLTLEYGLKKGFITEEEFRGVKEYLPRKGG